MFGGDPFDPFGMRRQMRDMDRLMDSMMGDFFGGTGFPSAFGMIDDGRQPQYSGRSRSSTHPQQSQPSSHDLAMAHPFGGMGMGIFDNMFRGLGQMASQASNNPNSMMFSQSTMISCGPDGKPKVVQNQMRKSGDVRETRRTVQDGDRRQDTIGHAIGDRAHYVEKKRDADGRIRSNQRYVNLDEEEAADFTREFEERKKNGSSSFLFGSRSAINDNHAIENGGGSSSGSSYRSYGGSGGQPIIEIPDDDEPAPEPQRAIRSGPRITEITDDDNDNVIHSNQHSFKNASKRRRNY